MGVHWSNYWSQGHHTSFGSHHSNSYEGKIKDIWNDTFERELRPGCQVLDVGCGNGALAMLIAEYSNLHQMPGQYVGIDAAKLTIDNRDIEGKFETQFFPESDFLDFNFNDAIYDLVISQFGIEYIDPEKTPTILSQITSGACCFFMHHDKSTSFNRNKEILQLISSSEYKELIVSLELLVKEMGEVKDAGDIQRVKKDPACERYRKQFNDKLEVLKRDSESALIDTGLIAQIGALFQTGLFWPLSKKEAYLDFIKTENSQLCARLQELSDASYSRVKLLKFIEKMEREGFALSKLEYVRDSGIDYGVLVVFRKA